MKYRLFMMIICTVCEDTCISLSGWREVYILRDTGEMTLHEHLLVPCSWCCCTSFRTIFSRWCVAIPFIDWNYNIVYCVTIYTTCTYYTFLTVSQKNIYWLELQHCLQWYNISHMHIVYIPHNITTTPWIILFRHHSPLKCWPRDILSSSKCYTCNILYEIFKQFKSLVWPLKKH